MEKGKREIGEMGGAMEDQRWIATGLEVDRCRRKRLRKKWGRAVGVRDFWKRRNGEMGEMGKKKAKRTINNFIKRETNLIIAIGLASHR